MANYYIGDMTWSDLTQACSQISDNLRATLQRGLEEYNEWQRFRAGRTNAQIATAVSKAEADIAAMDAAFAAAKALYDYANNQTPTQSDYLYSLRSFSR